MTVVVTTHDCPDRLAECIDSIFAGRVIPDRLVVVDNPPSTDATATLVAQLARTRPRLCYVREDRHALAATRRARRILTPPATPGLPPYPRELTIQQWRGLASGPWRYLRRRHHAQRQAVG